MTGLSQSTEIDLPDMPQDRKLGGKIYVSHFMEQLYVAPELESIH
jgi:hypothetical protein